MTPTDLLAAARRLLDRPDAKTAAIWPRAAALLARQALEQGLDQFWRGKGLSICKFIGGKLGFTRLSVENRTKSISNFS